MIYIYDDNFHGNVHLQLAVNSVLPDANVCFCTASMILDGCLDKCDLFLMPGGADLYFCEKLNGNGNSMIRDFVAQGGSYLGTCAGAYYGCSSLDWESGEIVGPRELAFYEGCATGPIYPWIENPASIYEGSWKKAVQIETQKGESFLTLYNGGPVFDEPYRNDSYVIARYSDLPDTPPAIVGGTLGKGKYILSSPHLEKFGHLLDDGLYKLHNKSYEREKKVHEELLPHEAAQKEFLKSILMRLL